MQGYILGVCGAAILSALITILLPEGRTGKFVTGILRLFCLLVLLLPLFSLAESFSFTLNGKLEPDREFLEYMCEERAREEEQDFEALALEKLDAEVDVTLTAEVVEWEYVVSKVTIKIIKTGMNGEDGHIFIIERLGELSDQFFPGAEVFYE